MGKRVKAARAAQESALQMAQIAAAAPGATQADKDKAAQLQAGWETEQAAHKAAKKGKGLKATLEEIHRSPLDPIGFETTAGSAMRKELSRPGATKNWQSFIQSTKRAHQEAEDPSGRKTKMWNDIYQGLKSPNPNTRAAAKQQWMQQKDKAQAQGRNDTVISLTVLAAAAGGEAAAGAGGGTAGGAAGAGAGGATGGGAAAGGTAASAAGGLDWATMTGTAAAGGGEVGAGTAGVGATAAGGLDWSTMTGSAAAGGGTVGGGAVSGTAAAGGGMSSLDWGSIAKLAGGVISATSAGKAGGTEKRAAAADDPFAPYRAGYAQQLSSLMQDPSQVMSDPGFQFGLDLGEQAIQRSEAQRGELGSGREAIELQQFAQGYAGQYLQQKESFLAGLGGAQLPPTRMAGAQMATGAQQNELQQWGQLIGNVDWSSLASTISSWF